MSLSSTHSSAEITQSLAHFIHNAKLDDLLVLAFLLITSTAYATKGALWNRPDPYRYKLFEKPQAQSTVHLITKQSRELQERLHQQSADVAVLWASQSGTAERFAGRLAKELRASFGAKVLLLDASDIDPASLAKVSHSKVVIILASTFGEGDPSDNFHEFWSWLHSETTSTLHNLRFLAFGLGNFNYKHYNHVINVVADGLQARGARLLAEVGRADDAAGETEEHFISWKELVLDLFEKKLHHQRRAVSYEASLEIVEDSSLTQDILAAPGPKEGKPTSTQSKTSLLPIIQSRELLVESQDRKCMHLELDISHHPQLKYKTGDYCAIWPTNPDVEVDLLFEVLGLGEKRYTPHLVRSLDDAPAKVPSPITLNAIFQSHVEVCAPISREHVTLLATYAPTDFAREILAKLGNDKVAYSQYLQSSYVNLGRLLRMACNVPGSWSGIPTSLVIEMLPAMQPRSYSISSSSVLQARQVAITVAVADTLVAHGTERIPGLATNYLMRIRDDQQPHGTSQPQSGFNHAIASQRVYATLRRSNFKLPAMASTPIIMIAAGTGIAPFRAFVQERARLKSMGRPVGTTKLIFGCRNPKTDFIYADEFSSFAEQLGDSFSMTTAFSRPTVASRKQYVQDIVGEQADTICNLLIEENAYFYVCGSAAMARGVSKAVADVLRSSRGWTESQMDEFADRQKRQKRWQQDAWG